MNKNNFYDASTLFVQNLYAQNLQIPPKIMWDMSE